MNKAELREFGQSMNKSAQGAIEALGNTGALALALPVVGGGAAGYWLSHATAPGEEDYRELRMEEKRRLLRLLTERSRQRRRELLED